MNRKIAVISMIAILILVNWSVFKKEKHLAEGKLVYLELAPVDPRSLMQGDYMDLNYKLSDEVYKALPRKKSRRFGQDYTDTADGFVIVKLDEKRISSFKSIYENQPLLSDEILLRYRVRNGNVKFATNAFFFQEGHGKYYESARYGEFRVDDNGELLLVAMHDKDLSKLEPDS